MSDKQPHEYGSIAYVQLDRMREALEEAGAEQSVIQDLGFIMADLEAMNDRAEDIAGVSE